MMKAVKAPRALFAGLLMIALAILGHAMINPGQAQREPNPGYFLIASDGDAFVWRVNTATGEVSYCARNSDSLSEASLNSRQPFCSQSSQRLR
mgnify:CR=1 FL=1